MPAYNAAAYIGQSIESVIRQTYSAWELIVVDDGSTDNTRSVVEEYIAKDSRVKYLWQQNGRQGKARNFGLAQASGNLIAFLDADDLWEENKLAFQTKLLERSNADLVFGSLFVIQGDNLKNRQEIVLQEKWWQGDDAIKAFVQQNQLAILTVLCTKAAIEKAGRFTEEPGIQNAEDYHLWLKMLFANCRFLSHSETLASYRIHTAASTHQDKNATLQVVNALLQFGKERPEYAGLFHNRVMELLKGFLYHHKLQSKQQATIIAHQLSSINRLRVPYSLIKGSYSLLGDKYWRSLVLKCI